MNVGVIDSVNLGSIYFCATRAPIVRKRLWHCVLANILVCVPGILVDTYFAPFLKWLLELEADQGTVAGAAAMSASPESATTGVKDSFSSASSSFGTTIMTGYYSLLYMLYQFTLVYPFLLIALVFNTIWYQQISDAVTSLLTNSQLTGDRPIILLNPRDVSERAAYGGDVSGRASNADPSRASSLQDPTAEMADVASSDMQNVRCALRRPAPDLMLQEQPEKNPTGVAGIIRVARDELYRGLVVTAFILQHSVSGWLCSQIPILFFEQGTFSFSVVSLLVKVLLLAQLSALYSYYAFEYRWVAENWTLESRFQHVELRLPYFVGFGFILAFAVQTLPGLWSTAFFGLGLPFLVVIAAAAPPRELIYPESKLSMRVPLFGPARALNHAILPLLGRYIGNRSSKS